MYVLNATSLAKTNAVQLLQTELMQFSSHCALITETWYTAKHLNSVVSIEGYNLFRRDRNHGRGGGVCVYVKNDVDCCLLHPQAHDNSRPGNIEIMWIKCYFCEQNYYIACCYHPPLPKYRDSEFIELLARDIDYINSLCSDDVIVVAGDFNQLDTSFLTSDLGLVQLVTEPTHCGHIIDKVFVSRPDLYGCFVVQSTLKTKHKAVILDSERSDLPSVRQQRAKVKLYDLREPNVDRLRYYLGTFPWERLMELTDVEQVYHAFVDITQHILSFTVPVKKVSMGLKDPEFITPRVKAMLRKRNRLRRKGRLEEADSLAHQINKVITDGRSNTLTKLETASTKELWNAVNKTRNSKAKGRTSAILRDPDAINTFFAKVATKDAYDVHELDSYCCNRNTSDVCSLTNVEVERLLGRLKLSASGCDDIPAWLLRKCSFELADIVAYIINCSINSGKVTPYWLNAVVTPVPKTDNPSTFSHFRPISVTPHISRLTEKIIVRRWLLPAIPPEALRDQYAFKPTGSTTAALVFFMHRVTKLLEDNNYVRCLMVDFSKAFDMVDHVILIRKLINLGVPDFIVNWICSFLTGRSQQCKVNGRLSRTVGIGLSVVQGSGIGPILYAAMKSDLHTLSELNDLFKYADDTTLLVPEHTDTSINDEYEHIKDWADDNKLLINEVKTKEIVFRRPNPTYFHIPSAMDNIEQLDSVKLLGIMFNNKLKMDVHVKFVLSQCAQRMYILKLLKHQGMPLAKLHVVAHSLIVSHITYALPAWGGFVSAELIGMIDAMLRRLKRFGYLIDSIKFQDLLDKYDEDLLDNMSITKHCLHHLLPPVRPLDSLRERGHPFSLPDYNTNIHKKSFVVRTLYKFI